MPGISNFAGETFNFNAVLVKAANYTVLLADEQINTNGAYTMTLPVISTMKGTYQSQKAYKFTNIHATATATISAGTGNTINGRASIALRAGESLIIKAGECDTAWTICDPYPIPVGIRNLVLLHASTNGTTPVNLIDASGSTVVGMIVDIDICNCDATAGNIITKVGNTAVSTVAKGTTANWRAGATTIDAHKIAVGDTLTVESSSTGNALVKVLVATQKEYLN